MTIKIDTTTAEAEFERWCERARIDTEFDESTEDGTARVASKKRIIKAIEKGLFIVNDDGIGSIPAADVKGASTEIVFSEFYAGMHVAMDRKKDGQDYGKLHASLSALTKKSDVIFVTMHPEDKKICYAVAALFLV